MLAGLADNERFCYFQITFVTQNSIQNDQFFIFVFCSHTPPFAETIPPAGSPRNSISAVPSDIRNSAVNTFRWNQQTSETSVIERVWGDPHQDKSHRRTGWQTTLLLNMGGSCSYLYPSI